MSEEKKPDTRFVTGGVYEQKVGDIRHEGVLFGAEVLPRGKRRGVMRVGGRTDEWVIEGSIDFNNWTLIKEPVSVEFLRAVELRVASAEAVSHELELLRDQVTQVRKAQREAEKTWQEEVRVLRERLSTPSAEPGPVPSPNVAVNVASAEPPATVSAQAESSAETTTAAPLDALKQLRARTKG